jgi:hypothetical protein
VRNADAGREIILMRSGMPPQPRTGRPAGTNIRNTSSPHWRCWLKLATGDWCHLINSFTKYAPEPTPETKKKGVVWFALNPDRPLTAWRQRLLDDPCLLILRPAPSPLRRAKNLDSHRLMTLKLDLRSYDLPLSFSSSWS